LIIAVEAVFFANNALW